MPTRSYNRFTPWVEQDDYLTNWPGFVEHKNMDGIKDGYALHLWPKVNKAIITTNAISSIEFRFQAASENLEDSIIWWENGEIYRLNSTDSTPLYTLAGNEYIISIALLGNDYYIFYKQTVSTVSVWVAKVNANDVENGSFSTMNETFKSPWDFSCVWCMPIKKLGNYLYFCNSWWSVARMDSLGTVDPYWFPDDYTVGITIQGTTVVVYTRSGNVYLWDGSSLTASAQKYIWFRISKVTSKGWLDYLTSDDGQLYVWTGFSFERITKPKISNRMNNSSSYDKRLSFNIDETNQLQNRSMTVWLDDVYLYSSDTIKGIYKYGKLQDGMRSGLHKIVTQNHLWTQIDYVYDFYFYERNLKRMYFSYKAGATYWVDYIDLDSMETATDGYAITEVFSWNSASFVKKINQVIRSTSNTSWSNYIDIHYRINNGAWELIRRINDATDTIKSSEITKQDGSTWFRNNNDVQFKFTFHNDDGWVDSPALHEVIYEYNLI